MTFETLTIEVEANTQKAQRSFEALNGVADDFSRGFTRALSDAVVRGRDLDDTFRSLALTLANSALRSGLAPLQGVLSNGLQSLFSSTTPGGNNVGLGNLASSFANALPFARGGVVSTPSFFPLNQGMGVAGEAGPEAILPLQRGRDGRLGVGSAGSAPSNITVNISTPDIASFQRSEAQVTSMLARAVQRSRRFN